MATLEKIRKRSGLLIIVIGLAMLAFILTDLLGSGGSVFMGDVDTVAKIDGEKITQQEFSARMDERMEQYRRNNQEQDPNMENITTKQFADAVWDELLREKLYSRDYEKLGFLVTSEELFNKVAESREIRSNQNFIDPQTGQFSKDRLRQALANLRDQVGMDEQATQFWRDWVSYEENLKRTALRDKYNTAIQKGLYITDYQARKTFINENKQFHGNFIHIPFDFIPDEDIEVTEKDLERYYDREKKKYEMDKTRDLAFVTFDIGPSEEDRENVRRELEELREDEIIYNQVEDAEDTIPGFENTEDDSAFVSMHSDQRYDASYYSRDELEGTADTVLFNMEIGEIFGPYEENGSFHLVKLNDIRTLPDSAEARHILITHRGSPAAQQQQQQQLPSLEEARELADSLLGVVKNDTSQFAELAQQFSDDPGSGQNGGELGSFTYKSMVPSFADFCFKGEVGDIGMVRSQYGYHIVEVLDQKGESEMVRRAKVSREILVSDKTLNEANRKASSFASGIRSEEEFFDKAEKLGYSPRPVGNIKIFDENISGLGNNRSIVKWAFDEEREEGDINIFANGDENFAAVMVTGVIDGGYTPLKNVRDDIEANVKREKKAEKIEEQMSDMNVEDMEAVASHFNSRIGNVSTSFNGSNLPNVGNEPEVIGTLCGLDAGETYGPVTGKLGVYVVRLNRADDISVPDILDPQKSSILQRIRPTFPNKGFEALKENANIEDRRHIFY